MSRAALSALHGATKSSRGNVSDVPVPRGLRIVHLQWFGKPHVVLSFELDDADFSDVLTQAEQEVAQRVLEGHSNAAIAQERARSIRTIANQVAAVFRKLNVRSRAELATAVARRMSAQRTGL